MALAIIGREDGNQARTRSCTEFKCTSDREVRLAWSPDLKPYVLKTETKTRDCVVVNFTESMSKDKRRKGRNSVMVAGAFHARKLELGAHP